MKPEHMTREPLNVVRLVAGSTMSYSDRIHNAMLIRGARPGDREAVIRVIAEQRRAWHEWQCMTQRQWQCKPRSIQAAERRYRHFWIGDHSDEAFARAAADDVATRERYVRGAFA